MAFNRKAMLSGDFHLESLDTRVLEFDDFTAGDTDQMIMMLVMIAGLETCLAISKMTLLSDAALCKQFQAAMNGCITDARVLLAQTQIELLSRKMRSGTKKLFENKLTLVG